MNADSATTPPPEGSVTPANLPAAERDRDYFLDHEYVREAMAYGNKGFRDILARNSQQAREDFVESTQLLSTGLVTHKEFAAERAETQSAVANLFTVGLMVAGAAVAVDSAGAANSTAQMNSISRSLSNYLDASGNLGGFLQNQIRLGELNSSAVERVDRDRWRSVVVSDHKFARSIVRIHNQTRSTMCTGYFISPYVIVTAAHCFELGDALGAFRQNPANGEGFMTGEDQFIEIEQNYQHNLWNPRNTQTRPYDVAFLIAKEPSGSYLPVSTRTLQPGDRLMAIGYSGDLNDGFFLQIDYGCKVTSIGPQAHFGNNCVIYKGNSGGPIITADGEIAAVGINSSGYMRRDRSSDDTFSASLQRAAAVFDGVMQDPALGGRITANPFN